ncbi:hypothetical protein [Phenylobacterium sp. J367]|uniref:hypothetical protein n=1 Tax=Phenylobacterium sp. J367 TaxID=2898435 RepID=UPI00215166D4|nr:hypothetical protein [Phenylobacterium sp. J367]MCR5877841.1 hypothetical protein [Phenylobacterium sp. J367]
MPPRPQAARPGRARARARFLLRAALAGWAAFAGLNAQAADRQPHDAATIEALAGNR